jgi:hypothetical protein
MRWAKILGAVVGVLVVLVIGAGAALYLGGGKAVKWVLEHPASTMIGRTIAVEGPVRLRWGDPSRLVIKNLHVANADWDKGNEMLAARRIEVTIYLRTLVWGPMRIPSVAIDGAKLLLETNADGTGNWKFGVGNGAPKKRIEFPLLQKLRIADSELLFLNGKTKARADLKVANLALDDPNRTSPVTASADGSFQNLPVKVATTLGAFNRLRDASQPYPVKLNGSWGQVDLAVDGTIKEPLDFDGLDLRLSLSGSKLDQLATAMGVPMPELPDFKGTSKLAGGNGQWQVNALTLKVGNSNLEGGLAIDTNQEVPHLTANLTSSDIDLADFKGLYGGHPEKSSAPPPPDNSGLVIPDTKIEVHKLPGIDLTLKFDGAKIEAAGGLPFERVVFGLGIHDGDLTVDPLSFHLALGDIALRAKFNPFTAASPPRLQGRIDIQHIDLHNLLGGPSMPAIVQQTAGTAGGFVVFDTNGVSLREFMAHMNGDLGVFVANGQMSTLLGHLAPIDVLESLGALALGDKPQPVNCMISRFGIQSGVATASTLLMKTPSTTIVGAGNVNFAGETITLNLKPYNNGFAPVSLRTPVDIGGTLKKPAFHLEVGNLVARLGAAVGLGVLFPPAAILPLVDTGLGPNNACQEAYAAQNPQGNPNPKSGSSVPPAAAQAPAPAK